MKNAIENDGKNQIELYYWNKKEAFNLLRATGLQLPSGAKKSGFIHSIDENGSIVKKKLNSVFDSLQFKRWFGNSSKSYYKVHRIIMPDGAEFSFENKNRDIAERAVGNNKHSGLSPADNISTESIARGQAESQEYLSGKDEAADLRLSLKPASSISEENRRLIEENETYKALIGKLNRQIAALQKKVVDPKGVRKLAKDVRAQYGADDAIRPADRKAGGRFFNCNSVCGVCGP